MELTEKEMDLATALDFRVSILQTLKNETQNPINQGFLLSVNNEPVGFKHSVFSNSNKNSIEALQRIRKWLLGSDYTAFTSDIKNNELSIMKSKNQFDIIYLQETNGGSFDLSTDEIVQKLSDWNCQFRINILGANYSWVLVQFNDSINNIPYFIEELMEFCPDLNQIYKTKQELKSQIINEKKLLLWWD